MIITPRTKAEWVLAEFLANGEGCKGCNLRGLHSCGDETARKICWLKKANEIVERREKSCSKN